MSDPPPQSLVFVNANTGRIDRCAREPREAELIGIARRGIEEHGVSGDPWPIGEGWYVDVVSLSGRAAIFTMIYGHVPAAECALHRDGFLGDVNPWLVVMIKREGIGRIPLERYHELVALERAVAWALLEGDRP
jgi:hypothetical protein